MIRYRLICDTGHEFDAWFPRSSAFDEQSERGFIVCAECGSGKVGKALMAPSVVTRTAQPPAQEAPPARQAATPPPSPPSLAAHLPPEAVELLRKVRQHVLQTAENVGDRFAEEARKIHFEEAEARGIYGQATREEAEQLIDEGIDFHPLPHLPEDAN